MSKTSWCRSPAWLGTGVIIAAGLTTIAVGRCGGAPTSAGAPAATPTPAAEVKTVVPSMDLAVELLNKYLAAVACKDYGIIYSSLHPLARPREPVERFNGDFPGIPRVAYGDVIGFGVGEMRFHSRFRLVVDAPANRPLNRRGSSPSRVILDVDWTRENGAWRLVAPPWQPWIKRGAVGGRPPGLFALDDRVGPTGSIWSAEKEPVPECLDAAGLEQAEQELLRGLLAGENAAVYDLLCSTARSGMSFAQFDDAMRRLQADWLKPIRVHSVFRPELQVSIMLQSRATPELLKAWAPMELKQDDRGAVRLPCFLTLRLDDGKWYIWWPYSY